MVRQTGRVVVCAIVTKLAHPNDNEGATVSDADELRDQANKPASGTTTVSER
jgi:hypothetical protein